MILVVGYIHDLIRRKSQYTRELYIYPLLHQIVSYYEKYSQKFFLLKIKESSFMFSSPQGTLCPFLAYSAPLRLKHNDIDHAQSKLIQISKGNICYK